MTLAATALTILLMGEEAENKISLTKRVKAVSSYGISPESTLAGHRPS